MRVQSGGVDCHPCSRKGEVKEQDERENAKKTQIELGPLS